MKKIIIYSSLVGALIAGNFIATTAIAGPSPWLSNWVKQFKKPPSINNNQPTPSIADHTPAAESAPAPIEDAAIPTNDETAEIADDSSTISSNVTEPVTTPTVEETTEAQVRNEVVVDSSSTPPKAAEPATTPAVEENALFEPKVIIAAIAETFTKTKETINTVIAPVKIETTVNTTAEPTVVNTPATTAVTAGESKITVTPEKAESTTVAELATPPKPMPTPAPLSAQLGAELLKTAKLKSESAPAPQWTIAAFPEVIINQKDYPLINLNDYVAAHQDEYLYSLTPGKINPDWLHLQPNGLLSLQPAKISPEDVGTTQIIYVTATGQHSAQSTAAEITIKISPNFKFPAPEWRLNVAPPDAIANRPYYFDLSKAIRTDNLPNDDQLTFQLAKSAVNWLQIGDDGFSLVSQKIPTHAAGKYIPVILRATSKISGKSTDFDSKIYVNPIPQPLEWKSIPHATLNTAYELDLSHYISSNIKNDRFSFQTKLSTLPNWLSLQNLHILTGIPKEAQLIKEPQKISVIAISEITGQRSETTLELAVDPDSKLNPHWKTDFLTNPIINETYRSDDLITALENSYPQDELTFEYLNGPQWLTFNPLCHCLTSKGDVPEGAAGQTYTIHLRVNSKASGKSVDYAQSLKVYTGIPHWLKTTLPNIKIGQTDNLKISLHDYVQNDVSDDHFTYTLDAAHSPNWVSLSQQNEQTYLVIDANAIHANEVNTAQTVRLLATSQSTHKTSTQLLTIQVVPNPALPSLVWRGPAALPTATVDVVHATDLSHYIHSSIANDRLTIRLGANSPNWLSIHDNKLVGSPPRNAIGGPYPVTLLVHSQASNTNTELKTKISAQFVIVSGDNMETHSFLDNYRSIVIRGLKKNHTYHLVEAKGRHFDYGPFYSQFPIKTGEDWNGYPFYAVNSDHTIKTGDDGTVSIVYYTQPFKAAPEFDLVILR